MDRTIVVAAAVVVVVVVVVAFEMQIESKQTS